MFDAIASAPGVECGVIGLPDDKWDERAHAIIAVRLGRELSAEQVIAHCREHIAGYKCPARHRLPRRDAVVGGRQALETRTARALLEKYTYLQIRW